MALLEQLWSRSERRSLENPSTPLSAPDDWLFDSLGSFRASSGVNVNRETALTYDAYWRCCALISGDVAKTHLYLDREDGTKWIHAVEHPAYRLLLAQACPEIAALHFKRVLTFHGLAEGNGYAYIVRDGGGRPRELWPLSPMKTYPVRENQTLWYVTQAGDGGQRKIPAEDMFHLRGLSFDGLVGYAAVAKMREALGLALAYENFGSIFFRNNARPNVVLKHPGRLSPEARSNLRESWERIHVGLENAHRTAVLEEAMDVVPLMHNARDSQLLEGKSFSRVQIANFFGVPPHKVGDSSRTSYNSLEQENQEYLEDGAGLGYWLAAWCTEAWFKLLTDQQRQQLSHRFRFDKKGLLRATLQTRTQYYVQMLQNGVLCPDEVRAEEGLNPRPDGQGGQFVQALNMKVAGPEPLAGDGNAQDDDKQDDDKPKKGKKGKKNDDDRGLPAPPRRLALPAPALLANRGLILDVATRMLRRIGHAVETRARKPADWDQWLGQLDGDHGQVLAEAFRPAAAAIAATTGRALPPEVLAGELLDGCLYDLFLLAGRATPRNLEAEAGQLIERWAAERPAALADSVCYRKADKPYRSQLDAIALVNAMPEKQPDRIGVVFPYHAAPYDVNAAWLKERMDAGKVKHRTVRIRQLYATQIYLRKKDLLGFIKDPHYPNDHKNIGGLPDDCAYVIRVKDSLFVYDGHHRLSAQYLQGVGKTVVYCTRWKG